MNLKNPWNGWMPRERLILALFFFCTIKKLKGLLSHSHLSICSLFTFWKKAWPWWKRYRELRTEYFIYSLQSHMGQGYQCSSHGTGKGSRGDFRIEGLSTIFAAGKECVQLCPLIPSDLQQGMPSRWSCLHLSVYLLLVGWCGKLAVLFKATWNSCCQALLEIDLMWWLNNWSECGPGYKWTWTGSCLLKKLLHLSSIRNHRSASKFTLSLLSLLRSWGKNTCI